MGSHTLNSVQILITMKYTALLLLGVLHSSQGLCFLNKCSSYWSNAKKNSTITEACAGLFDENCCKTGDTHFVIPRGGQGKMCGTISGINPLSSCKGPRLEDDVESFIVMPVQDAPWKFGTRVMALRSRSRPRRIPPTRDLSETPRTS